MTLSHCHFLVNKTTRKIVIQDRNAFIHKQTHLESLKKSMVQTASEPIRFTEWMDGQMDGQINY